MSACLDCGGSECICRLKARAEAAEARARRLESLVLAMLAYKDGRDAGKPKDEAFVRAWLEMARDALGPTP